LLNAIEDSVGADAFEAAITKDSGATGRFEVEVNGQLVHSKATKGQGKAESAAEKEAIINAIKAAM